MNPSSSLYTTQERVAAALLKASPIMANAKLCGGTALSRFYLGHRTSYDLDYFLEAFSPVELAADFQNAGLNVRVVDQVNRADQAAQLHTFIEIDGVELKVSFIEDMYFTAYPALKMMLGPTEVTTESIDGLYHRKLRTVAGHDLDSETPVGGRQTARDLFDLYVLSEKHSPLLEFIDSLPFGFPVEAFRNGLASMPWMTLLPEFSELEVAQEWSGKNDVEVVRLALLHAMNEPEIDLDALAAEFKHPDGDDFGPH